jgi:dTDP-4-dehydrorhamnose 3,5-epimerase
MKFEELSIKGVFLITAEPFVDERGSFRRNFCQKEFSEKGLASNLSQTSISENTHRFTLRGFHFQAPPHEEIKIVSCLRGTLYDVVVDLRPASPTFKKWVSVELNEKNGRSLYIPKGCGHGFLTLSNSSLVLYYMTHPYVPELARGVRYDDPAFRVKWPHEPLYISQKDKSYPDFTG